MQEEIFTVQFVNEKNCFFYFSDQRAKKLSNLAKCGLKITLKNCDSYASWSSKPISTLQDNEVGINPLFAQNLGLKKGANILITTIQKIPQITFVKVFPVSEDDWEILEMNAEKIQSSLLNQIRVIFVKQKIVIWISQSVYITVQIVLLSSNFVYGWLENFTEVEILTENADNTANLFDLRKTKNNECTELYTKLEKYKFKHPGLVFRVQPFNFGKISNDNSIILYQPFNIFVHKCHISDYFIDDQKENDFILCKLSAIKPPNVDSFENNVVYVRLCAIEDFYEKLSDSEKIIIKDSLMAMNYPIVIVPEDILKLLNVSVGSKIFIENDVTPRRDITEIRITTSTESMSHVIDNIFKLYVSENTKAGGILLNNKTLLKITDEVTCFVKWKPDDVDFFVLNSDTMRNVKIVTSYNRKHIEEMNGKINDEFALKKPNYCSDVYVNIDKVKKLVMSSVNILKLGLNFKQGSSTDCFKLNENLLITGIVGSGKSSIAKTICKLLTQAPYYAHEKFIECKPLRGKKVETVHKLLLGHFDDAVYYQPSVIVLDDLDIICHAVNESSEGPISAEAYYFNRMSEMIDFLITEYQQNHLISLIVTVQSVSKLNKLLYSPRGQHLFSSVLETPVLEKADRETLLKNLLNERAAVSDVNYESCSIKTEGYVIQDLVDLTDKCVFESYKRVGNTHNRSIPTICNDDLDIALQKSVALSLRDVQIDRLVAKKWNQIGGLEDAKTILIETIKWPVQYPELFKECPIRLQTGVLLYGPPGTGKTILAGAAASEFHLRLISVKGPELLSKYIGASEEAVRNVFEKAQSAKPCILFFDEFDSLAPRRGHDNTGVTDRVVNQFLTQLDGVESLVGVYVIAATSRPDLLDPALLRPGRLGRQVHCPLPDNNDRLSILKALSASLQLSSDVDLLKLSELTEGFTGADLQAVLYTAQLSAVEEAVALINNDIQEGNVTITNDHLMAALKETRPSLSKEEKAKYDKIHIKFQGGKEIQDLRNKIQKVTLA